MVGGVNGWLRRARFAPLAIVLACAGVAAASGAVGAVSGCSATPAYAYGATYGSNCYCSLCTVFCNTPRGPYKNGTCC